ncbi:hypothetical protein CERSUDRAFT_118232 [Gelatoporia subvermispora B]|uniref:Uncharacterized protein n=1 Tax=Ceriporiopsis subvermispora (strain B) TaxID=914234 RepID=M2Q8I3_CERS8|nr:hypothetical protein CERSUDRAFT_118232 [Gelatoporia subvermispora B]
MTDACHLWPSTEPDDDLPSPCTIYVARDLREVLTGQNNIREHLRLLILAIGVRILVYQAVEEGVFVVHRERKREPA